jgi:hypothetical protein
MAREKDIAWAAGLFEGEGTLFLEPNGTPIAALKMTDQDVVSRFADIIGEGAIRRYDPPSPLKPIWQWRLGTKAKVGVLIDLLYPFLGARRKAKADEVRAACQQPKKTGRPVSAATRRKMSDSAKRRRARERGE